MSKHTNKQGNRVVRDPRTGRFSRVINQDITPLESADHIADLDPEGTPCHTEEEALQRRLDLAEKEELEQMKTVKYVALGFAATFVVSLIITLIFGAYKIITLFL